MNSVIGDVHVGQCLIEQLDRLMPLGWLAAWRLRGDALATPRERLSMFSAETLLHWPEPAAHPVDPVMPG